MARIAGVDLPRNKHMDRALTYIYGIGLTTARKILDKADLPANVTLRGVECFSNCDYGCSVTIRGGDDRWTYVYGNFTGPEDSELVADGVRKYAATEDGLVPWRERSIHFRKNCIARIPPLAIPE